MNLIVILTIILIILGTKFVNYYHKFFYIYNQLDNNEKNKYFCNNTLIKIISKNSKLKTFTIMYFLTPLIKINYLTISTLIYLMYALCDIELDNILSNNGLENYKLNRETPIVNYLNSPIINSPIKNDLEMFLSFVDSNDTQHENNNFKNEELENSETKLTKEINLSPVENNQVTQNENLDDYIIENSTNHFNKVNINIVEPNEITEPIEPIEIISMEEVDFGDYMTNLINNSDKTPNETINENLVDNKVEKNIPAKIKIGKKKTK